MVIPARLSVPLIEKDPPRRSVLGWAWVFEHTTITTTTNYYYNDDDNDIHRRVRFRSRFHKI